ncbi:MAG TPA: efflux RND transporter periplasmic adaptor subunit [Tepidisphaeraceae bacterium]|jgi:cobalt-zinc-cadmium efflux system membrane fusion protein|nr:efflux RND transporter periplasmic adaptor subunit [Tepidisphaeraceae bacterium]
MNAFDLIKLATFDWRGNFLVAVLSALVMGGCDRGKDKDDAAEKKASAGASATQPADKDEGEKVKLTAEAVEKYGLRIGKVKMHVLVPTFTVPARVSFNADATARVGSVVPGRVVELKAKRGDMVQKGEELLVVESTDLGEAQSDYLQKTTALTAAATAVAPTRISYERAKRLYEQSEGLSLAELQKREAEFRAAQALQEAAQGALSAAERKLSLLGMNEQAVQVMAKSGQVTPRYSVRAPMSGRVIERDATLGQFVSPDKDTLIQLADMSTLWVLADVPEARLPDVAMGATVRVTVPAGGSAIPGVVSFIASTVDPATRAAQIRIDVKGDDTSLKAGMFAQVEIEAATEKDKARQVIAVPEEAIQIINGQTCVFIEDDDEENAFIKRPVAIAREVNGMVPVLSGLREKEEIVKSGGFFLKAEFAKSSVKDND